MQVSAKNNLNINEAFQKLAENIYNDFEIKKKRNNLNSTSVLTKKSFQNGPSGGPGGRNKKTGCC